MFLCHASTRCLFLCPITLQAQPNQQATTAEFDAWASSVGLRVELCSHARGTLRQLGYLAPPARIPNDRSYLWSLISTSSSSGGAGSRSGSPAGSTCSGMAGASVSAASASLSSGGASSPSTSSASTRGKPSQQPLPPAQHLPARASLPKPKQMHQRQPAAGAVPKPKLPQRHRLAVEGVRERQLHRQEAPVVPAHTTAGGAASRGTLEPAGPAGKLLSSADERAKPSPRAATAEPPGPVGPVSAGASQPGAGAQCHSVASQSAAAAAPAAAPRAQLPAGAVLPSAKQGQPPAVHAVVPAGTNAGAATAPPGGVPAKAPGKAARRKPRPAGNRNRRKRAARVREGDVVGALLLHSFPAGPSTVACFAAHLTSSEFPASHPCCRRARVKKRTVSAATTSKRPRSAAATMQVNCSAFCAIASCCVGQLCANVEADTIE